MARAVAVAVEAEEVPAEAAKGKCQTGSEKELAFTSKEKVAKASEEDKEAEEILADKW